MKASLLIKSTFLSSIIIGSSLLPSQAQDLLDVLRYSNTQLSGTARALGFGNALGSVGGDFTGLSVNPASIGIYRRSEVMFTPSLKVNSVSSDYINEYSKENNTRFNFNNIGIVFTKAPRGRRYENSDWKAISFGFGINRLADFNRTYSYTGRNTNTSFSQVFLNDAIQYPNDINNNTTLAYLGYSSYLIDKDSLGFFALPYEATTQLQQTRFVKERGGMNDLVFSLGGNYKEKLLVGVSLSVPTINYRRNNYFDEVDASGNPNNYFQAFRYTEDLQSTGVGFNLKAGAIYKPTDWIRLGAAIHTPTWIAMTDIYNQSITTNTETYKQTFYANQSDQNPISNASLVENTFDYTVRTPWKGLLSATAMLGKYGFISADYEYVDYTSARLGFAATYSQQEQSRNQEIRTLTKAASNFRIGAEGHFNQLYLRAGFGYYGSPYQNSTSDMNRISYSGGIGYRAGDFFTDLGWMHTRFNEYETPYTLPNAIVPTATLKNNLNNIALTIGFKM